MSMQEYKVLRKIQTEALKLLTKGRCPDKNIARQMPTQHGYNQHTHVKRNRQTTESEPGNIWILS